MNPTLRQEFIRLLGPDDFSDAPEDRLSYAYDATGKQYRYQPDAVAFPQNVAQIAAILKIANRHRLPVVPRGAGSGLTCGALASQGGLVMVMSGFDRILEIDADNMFAVVEPGAVTANVHAAVERQGLFYPPDPASKNFCTIGGNIAENAGGMRAVKYGVTRDYVMGLEVVLPTGEIVRAGSKCIKDVVGYDLTTLFVGSEGTLGIITRAILKLLPLPEARQTVTAAFATLRQAGQTVPAIIRQRVVPATIEFMDRHCIRAVENYLKAGLPSAAQAFLLMDVDGSAAEIGSTVEKIDAICRANGAIQVQVASDKAGQERLWKVRRAISAAIGRLPLRGAGEDIVVPRSRIPAIIEKMESITARYGLYAVNFGHAGDGNIHMILVEKNGPVDDEAVAAASREILEATVAMEGRIAAEHGIGLIKRDKIGLNIDSATLGLMQHLKRIVDPNNILNPGKIFPLDDG
jgi:glycolate oxidase